VLRLIDEHRLEQADIETAVQEGLADIAAGRYTLVATPEDDRRLDERLMARFRQRLTEK
jgi:predicted transcriptional regulator